MYREAKKSLDDAHVFNRAKNKTQERQYLEQTQEKIAELLRMTR
jgi:hypothetical protein